MRATARRVLGAADGARAGGLRRRVRRRRRRRRLRRHAREQGRRRPDPGPGRHDRHGHPRRRRLVLGRRQEGRRGRRQADGRDAEVLRVQQRPAEAGAADRRRGHREGRRPRRLGAEPGRAQGLAAKAADAGHPDHHAELGRGRLRRASARITHVGQTEEIAGEGAGAKFKEAGAKKLLCVIHEQSNIGLNQRCDGAKKGFGGDVENLQVKGTDDIQTTLTEIQSKLQADKSIDAVLALNPDIAVAARDAIKGAGSSAKLGTFDLSGDVVQAIQDGEIEFAVDQQQYLQGYLPVVFLTLNKTQREHGRRRPAGAHRARASSPRTTRRPSRSWREDGTR